MNKTPIMILDQQSWRGGGQRVLGNVLTSLEEDFEATVVFPDRGPFQKELQDRGYETLIHPLGSYSPGAKPAREKAAFTLRTVLCALRLSRAMMARKSALVYVNGARCLPFGVAAAWLTGKPVLFHLHNALSRRSDIALVSWLSRYVSKIIVCSNAAADCLLRSCPKLRSKIVLVRNCVHPAPENAQPAALDEGPSHGPQFTVGIVGRITEDKGHHILLQAVTRLSPEIKPHLRLLFVGGPGPECPKDEAYVQRLKSLARELALEERIVWTGHQLDLEPYYRQMDAVAIPSTAREGGGPTMVALEAMQRGLPVIVSGCGGNAECLRDGVNALVVPPGDDDALAIALRRVFEDSALRERLASAARQTIDQQFSPLVFSARIRRLVSEVCVPVRNLEPARKIARQHERSNQELLP
ncbi:MAG TPA: glycosyltransferase family 4 protein [Terriglobia bacterium]|nr:glycosyltransferase family 4 protein [Terriglobia bacterium]